MKEAFAFTVAQLLPVFALAGLVELEFFRRRFGKDIGEVQSWADLHDHRESHW